ncbi:disco-interacting protein 2 isoform X5 [Bradysia coprophila]|uniref:disco-interacting protein 2 isoform X5 n=1 Tax=Bradysia coprophila TaxID=38358 RepID=UPI00187D7811|nr:disco-interacting protein 2 isoform X5 [Bradysia coprophila]
MKPITFESIRNFLKTKKKNKKDGADASFKRSDSFKRISIRKSYLDRGRKRAIRTKAVIDFNEVDVKTGIYSGRPLVESKQFNGGVKEDFSLKNKSLQEINEICGGGEDDNDKYNSVSAPSTVDVDSRETETQTVAINFQGSNSTESIYNDLNNENEYEAKNDEKKLNISQISVAASLSSKHGPSSNFNIIEEDVETKSNFSSNSYFLLDENIYEKADSISKKRLSNADLSNDVTSDNQTFTDFDKRPVRYNSRTSLDKHSIKSSNSHLDSPNLVTFKTYCEPKTYIETSFDSVEPRSVTHSLESRSNVSRTSLNYEVVHATEIDSQTFKLPGKNKNEGVVIRIPAIVECDSKEEGATRTKQNLNKQISNDSALDVTEDLTISNNLETSLNGKFTFEIYKELQRSNDNILKECKQRNDSAPSAAGRVSVKKPSRKSKTGSSRKQTYEDPPSVHKSLDESFRSLQIDDQSENFFFEPEQGVYDEVNVISPDSSIPYPLRIKTNPFTRQKELYSVNLGRIWKQLNLGQEEDLSLEATSLQGNFKVKNESFKSMSSHDSGFSLTLTKPKNLFRRKSKKNRRKPKLSVSRDGYFKRVMVVQRNSSRRKKKKNTKQQHQQLNNMFDQSFYETLDRYYQESRRYGNNYPADGSKYYDNDVFMREFEEFCMRRNQTRIEKYKSKSFDEFLQFNNDDKFSQEISDLEAFFEEHLKRLKEYYLQKKQLNERTINELYHDYDRHGKQKEISSEEYKNNDCEDRFYKRSNDSLKVQSDRNHLNTIEHDETSLDYTSFDASLDYSFPHPDKRVGRNNNSKSRNKFQIQEVRPVTSSNELKYASLEFSNARQCDKKVIENAVPYADIQFPKEFNEFPYGKIKLNENRRTSRRKFKSLEHNASTAQTEISLSTIFPSVSSTQRDICHRCHKEQRNNHSIKDNADDILASDEFSENEFIANSIGCELCANCDNLYIDCVCSTNELDVSDNGKKVLFCKCSVEEENGRKLTTNKRKMKRKKSKRRLAKNHSTLRRGYSCTSDITQKGYEKKRTRLLQPYIQKNAQQGDGYYNLQKQQSTNSAGGNGGVVVNSEGYSYVNDVPSIQSHHRHSGQKSSSSSHREHQQQNRTRRTQRRVTHNEKRYHSEVRQEAVQQALAALKNRPKPSLPMPSKRSSVLNRSPDRDRDDSDSSSDEGSIPEERISTPDREYNYPRDHLSNSREQMKLPSRDHSNRHQSNISERRPQNLPPPPLSDTSSAGSPPAIHRIPKNSYDMTDISEFQQGVRPYAAPDITQFNNTRRGADRVTRYVNVSQTEAGDTSTTGRWKVSAKIQQLLNTLKRPKRRPLPEFYEDNDIELEIAANPKDPNAPRPEGNTMTPVTGEQLVIPSGLPRSLEAAVQRYGTNSFKAPMATVLDPNGKLTTTLTYGKLLSRAMKIAYALSTKVFSKGPESVTLKAGDTVALVYPNNDPLNFITAWYGCMFRGLVPLPIELPLSSSDSPPQQVGFLLSSCGIQVALTSEACLKGLPKCTTGEIAKLKGWPRLQWFVTEHLPKPPKDFNTNNVRINEEGNAYIEYTSDKDGSVMGVTVTRQAMMNHCRALTMACHYTEGETVVCVLDFKREVGLWHSVLTSVLNGMHVLFIPYALMKLRPSSWMQLITKYRASCCLVKSRDLHWGLLATKDHKDINLSSLRMLLVADGANPWSLSSCDQFLSVFSQKGLRADAICPCASSSEVFTVSLRRPGRVSGQFTQAATGRGVLSMAALSHGVVRVDSEDSLTSLTLQDCGQVMPAANMVVVRSEGVPVLCKTDQVGEICVTSGATGNVYFGLDGMTNATFKIQPLLDDPDPKDPTSVGKPISDELYVRSGLLGFLGPGGLVFICGSRDGLMTVTGRKHNADDIIATVLAVEPMRFIYRGRIAVFSIKVLRDERVCVIAEQRPDCSEEESFQWMSRVLQAVDSIHQVGIYCLALVPPNHLPKTPLGGIHLCEARRRFLEGSLHPANVLMCPHTCVTNLPKPREIHQGALQQHQVSGSSSGCVTDTSVGPASVMVGNLVQGNRLAVAHGRDIGFSEDNERKHQIITGVLRWRANTSPDHVLYTLLNSKGTVAKTLTCSELHKRSEKIAALLQERGKVNPGDHVALIFPPGLDLICAFYGCLYLGAVPITIRPPHPQNLITTLPTVRMIVDVSKSGIVLSIQNIIKLLKSREAAASIDPKSWPIILDIDDNPKRKLASIANCSLDSTAYLDFSVSTCGRLSGVTMTHRSLSSVCASLKLACELYPSRHVALCLDPYCGLGFAMWTLISVYSGHHSILIAPYEVEANPSLWLSTLSQYRVRDTFCSYGVIELCTKALSNSIQMLKQRNVNLACLRTCVVVAEERPRVQLTQQFCKLFQALGLNTRCVSTSFGCRVNPAICVQGASSAESAQVYVDLRALRNNRVALVERGAPNSLCLIESGKLLPGVKVIIANPETKGHCGDSHLGEIWVQSPHSANGYFTIYGDETDYNDHFNAKLVTGQTTETYARTGYLGFLRRTECSQAGSILDETTPSIASRDSDTESLHSQGTLQSHAPSATSADQELHDAVYVVGALDEVITLRGMNYHPIDIENSVLRCHKKIAECAVFTWTNLLVVVVELDGNESEALDLVPLVTNTVLEEHQLIVGVVVVVDPGVVPINSRGEKQRMHLRDGFLADQLDPIYVAYNM